MSDPLKAVILDGELIHLGPVIEAEESDKCELCGTVAELRPYGPNGERICHPCGQKDLATTERMMGKVLFGIEDCTHQPDDDMFCDAPYECEDPEHEHTLVHQPGCVHDIDED